MKKNVASQKIGAQMITAADGSIFTGSVTVEVTLDAGTQATGTVGSGACTHEGNGYHTYAPSQAETNGDLVAFTFHGTGAITATIQIFTTFPQTGDSFAVVNSGSFGNSALKTLIDTVDDFLDTEVAAIKAKTDNLPSDPADASDVAGAFTTVNTKLDTIDDFLDTEVAAIKAKTDNLPASPAAVGSAMTLTSAYDFAKGTVAMTEAYATNGAAMTPVEVLFMLWSILAESNAASTTITTKKIDGSTNAMTFTIDSSSAPTQISRTS